MPMVMDDARRAEASSARRDRRLKTSSPYARPTKKPQKTSGWGGFGNIIRNLFGRSTQDEEDSAMDETQDQQEEAAHEFIPQKPANNAAHSLSQRGHQMTSELATNGRATVHEGPRFARPTDPLPPPPPRQAATSPTSSTFSDPADDDLAKVKTFLREKQGQPMSEIETEGIIAVLARNAPPKEAPFRFSTSPGSTPGRGNSPFNFSTGSSAGANGERSTTPRKPLTRNPNGAYRWEGGGSAKPRTRNRYQSPAFGASRSTPEHIVLKDPSPAEPPKREYGKRRRVSDEGQSTFPTASSSANGFNFKTPAKNPPPRSPGPAPTPGRAALGQNLSIQTPGPSKSAEGKNGVASSSSSNNLLSPSAARTPKKPSFPAVPSPLRQTWNGDDSSSEGGSPRQKSKAAGMMEDLIKEVTPPQRKADIVNPYQSAVPGGKPMSRPKRARAKPAKAAKDAKTEKEKAQADEGKGKETAKPDLPQTAIELTLPAGSKRSRPPPHLASSHAPPVPTEPIIEEPSDEDDAPAAKRQKGTATPTNGDIDITEVDEDMPVPPSPKPAAAQLPAMRPSAFGNGNVKQKVTSAPKEPSKLRFSIQPEATTNAKEDEAPAASEPKADAPKTGSFTFGAPAASGKPTLAGFGFPSTRADTAKAPVSAFGKPAPDTSSPFTFGQPAPAEPPKAAPTFTFGKPQEAPKASEKPQPEAPKAAVPQSAKPDVSMAGPSDISTPQTVDEAKAVARAASVDSLPKYTFPKLPLTTSSGADATLCAEAKAVPRDSLPKFDFSASAVKASADAAAKAGPSTPSPAAPTSASGGFNWAAAGLKKPEAAGWTCESCMVPNKAEATKCVACDELKPGAASDGAAKPVGGFNWAAAGMKKPETMGWTCSTCMLPNKGDATQCVACEAPKP
ncbi:hypothetical protein EV715DRAFT_254160 [Schizophyllum commune]